MSRRPVLAVVLALVLAGGSTGCSWLRRGHDNPGQSATPTPSSTGSATATASPSTDTRPISEVLSRSSDAGGASVAISASLTGVSSTRLSGLLALDTGEGSGDYTSASGRTTQRIITGGKTYTSTGAGWIATPQSGRGLAGGDLPSLWSALRAAGMRVDASAVRTYSGTLPIRTALALSGIDANSVSSLNLTGATASATLTYNSDGIATLISIDGFIPAAGKTLATAMSITDVGQIVEVEAPSVAVTGGPEGQ